MDRILKYYFENFFRWGVENIEILSKKRTLEGWEVHVRYMADWGEDDSYEDVTLEEMFDATAQMMENLK